MTTETTRPTIPDTYLREIDGRILSHRGALEELTGLSKKSVDRLAGTEGFPDPVIARGPERRSWYDPDELVDVALGYERHRLGVDQDAAAGPEHELLAPREAAELIQVSYPGTFNKYIQLSEPSWRRGEAGILPIPDEERPRGTKQIARRWKRSTLITHQQDRPGRGGRPPAA